MPGHPFVLALAAVQAPQELEKLANPAALGFHVQALQVTLLRLLLLLGSNMYDCAAFVESHFLGTP